jgi:hypothetical protein
LPRTVISDQCPRRKKINPDLVGACAGSTPRTRLDRQLKMRACAGWRINGGQIVCRKTRLSIPTCAFSYGNDNTHERDRIQCAHRSHGYVGSHDESVSISCPKVLAKSPSRVGLEGQLTWREKCCLRRRFRQTSTSAKFCNSHEEHQTIFFQTSTSETRTRRNRCQHRRLQKAASQRLFVFFWRRRFSRNTCKHVSVHS